MAPPPRPEEVTPTDVHLVITPTARGQDLYAAIALPATVSCADARKAAREMRRSVQGPRLEAACVAELVLGDPAHRQAYDALRARAAAAGVPLPVIGEVMPAAALPPTLRVRARRWLEAQGPHVRSEIDKAFSISARFMVVLFKWLLVLTIVVLALVCVAKYNVEKQERYEVPRYQPPVFPTYDYTIPDYELPKFEMPDLEIPELRFDPPRPEPKPKKPPSKKPKPKPRPER